MALPSSQDASVSRRSDQINVQAGNDVIVKDRYPLD